MERKSGAEKVKLSFIYIKKNLLMFFFFLLLFFTNILFFIFDLKVPTFEHGLYSQEVLSRKGTYLFSGSFVWERYGRCLLFHWKSRGQWEGQGRFFEEAVIIVL